MSNVFCNFTVMAQTRCHIVTSAAHVMYYYPENSEREIENAREAMKQLNEAWAAVEKHLKKAGPEDIAYQESRKLAAQPPATAPTTS